MGKTFSIDLKSLYEHILDSHTYFGYWIEHEESDVMLVTVRRVRLWALE